MLVILIVASLSAACSTGHAIDQSASTSSATSAVPTSRSTTSTTSGSADRLEALLITNLPAGYVRQDDGINDTGPSDLAKALADETSAEGENVLRASGFVHGYQRLWTTQTGNRIIVFLYQFATPQGAAAHRDEGVHTAEKNLGATGATAFTIAAIPDAASYSFIDNGYAASQTAFTKDTYEVEIEVAVNAGTTLSTERLLQQLAVDQFNRL